MILNEAKPTLLKEYNSSGLLPSFVCTLHCHLLLLYMLLVDRLTAFFNTMSRPPNQILETEQSKYTETEKINCTIKDQKKT